MILILEDDVDLCELLADTLGTRGLEATPVTSAPEALAHVARRNFQLFITDVRMQGMDGLECLAALKKVRPAMRSIVMTGYASEDAPARALALEANDYLYKPFELKEFHEAVRRVLDAPRERESYRSRLAAFFKPDPEWEALRDLAFQTFYVAVRSRKLTEPEALTAWEELERLARNPLPPAELAMGYRCSIERVAALARTPLMTNRQNPEFSRFYAKIVGGRISVEQLKLAPYLRGAADELARTLWG